MKRQIRNAVAGFRTIPWPELRTYEWNTLKKRGPGDVAKLKNAITQEGFCFPVEIWSGHNYVVDGHGRYLALQHLEAEGYEIPDIPVIEIEAETLEAAKRLVLQRSSVHGKITQAGVDEFLAGMDLGNLDLMVSIPGIDVATARSSTANADDIDNFEDVGEEDDDALVKCPNCGMDFLPRL